MDCCTSPGPDCACEPVVIDIGIGWQVWHRDRIARAIDRQAAARGIPPLGAYGVLWQAPSEGAR